MRYPPARLVDGRVAYVLDDAIAVRDDGARGVVMTDYGTLPRDHVARRCQQEKLFQYRFPASLPARLPARQNVTVVSDRTQPAPSIDPRGSS